MLYILKNLFIFHIYSIIISTNSLQLYLFLNFKELLLEDMCIFWLKSIYLFKKNFKFKFMITYKIKNKY